MHTEQMRRLLPSLLSATTMKCEEERSARRLRGGISAKVSISAPPLPPLFCTSGALLRVRFAVHRERPARKGHYNKPQRQRLHRWNGR
ncbi:unnamed protein product [Enterobius vermicularis]|uniref:Secreted protein n=1 Tax=Enterobius vermicularis TaxID=51028 RepID=A0A0N4VJY6_ENTVE|nr:unnamed protein product [Enterobius vermicularis]